MNIKKIISTSLFALILTAPLTQAEVYELRTYTTHEGRLDDLLARFENHTVGLFEMHGLRNVAYWVPQDQADTLIYIIAHPDRESATANWDAFRNNPEWVQARAESRENGALVKGIVSVYMEATPWSPMQ
ncbi:NIPSNAP family protein [Haliea sp. AH-315-K21]|uniref:NIPSNAP family protein n=1 Tax=SAR86 cluster bacterium TaxID=2030880 RepID=A0A2A5C9V1_9GAMM|nr:NIPSNAP family protein [Haliea sp. AH-315-K21]MBN4075414.1 NIPSNAP family protein [Gammaproteobacteria bacterium AH-315-E17]PCJ40220.1 MAG: NIPSNAP family protein [SAR86 cluster bacterium]